MATLTLELNINSASNLANVNLMSKMDVYAHVTIHGDYTQKKQKVKTAVDRSGGSNPTWNHAVKFSVNETLARDGRSLVIMRLISRRLLGNKDIGAVKIPLLELLNAITPSINGDANGKEMAFVTYQVKSTSGKRKGSLNFSYRFTTPPVNSDLPVTVNRAVSFQGIANPRPSQIEHSRSAPPELTTKYRPLSKPSYQKDSGNKKHQIAVRSMFDPPLPVSYGAGSSPYEKSGYAYRHAPQSQSYISPPATSHQGYAPYSYLPPSPPGYGYGYPSKGIGLGLGLGAGLLGGLMMGDLVSDVANYYDL
ncbi:unnamed protein product [Microthlaspi erraticum]|uniref:C2 domain-containing protein n=1 Tax=Microthlaspi erraticum TaxID=1685480 RepID=A0A6D2KKY4_9BRAS|nr:unnamed protein product [Microthlaspi erraticum]